MRVKNMHQLKLTLLAFTTMFAVSSPAFAQEQQVFPGTIQFGQQNSVDLIGAGASIINSLINPPSRSAEIMANAEIKKAQIAAEAEITKEKLRIEASKSPDRVTPVLSRWGVSQVPCGAGAVFINGITTETVCIQPSNTIAAGYYTYDSIGQQLVRSGNSVPNIQTTTVSSPSFRSARDSSF
ncbi:hypothetical protein [Chamaesiphon polymorphus]|uniref:Uncharacterized protein n=1 Tax=Chamaesiphon polymorphus CCALA 037 TaxID=2107692 RepID=A0A2T1F634_9CYAN|nr:hypothetical protein [Chamaesiphon polymorphus]PSB40452.1 hypothetical protein C7B77_28325 [Chamaesiphon polymorphus CCALA 037]